MDMIDEFQRGRRYFHQTFFDNMMLKTLSPDMFDVSDGRGAVILSKMSTGVEAVKIIRQSYAKNIIGLGLQDATNPSIKWKLVSDFREMRTFKSYLLSNAMADAERKEYPSVVISDLIQEKQTCLCLLKGFRV